MESTSRPCSCVINTKHCLPLDIDQIGQYAPLLYSQSQADSHTLHIHHKTGHKTTIGPFQFLSDPRVWKTLEFQLHFISPNPMEDCGFVDVFYNLIHGKQTLNGLAGYGRHRIYIYIGNVIHRYFHGFSSTFHGKYSLPSLSSIGISMEKSSKC